MGLARTALLAGNNDEALNYFNKVLEIDPTVSEAWLGKGKAAGWQSTILNIRTPETIMAFNHAIATASDDHKPIVTSEAVEETNKVVVALYGMSRRHLDEFVALDHIWNDYLVQVSQLLDSLDSVRNWDPTNRVTLENIVHLCKDNIEGITYRNFDDTPGSWHLSPEYETLMKSRLEAAVRDLRAIDPSYSPPVVEKKKMDACFVVTATMGDANHPTVQLMRIFRDEWLSGSFAGRFFVAAYYQHGPKGAEFISKTHLRRRLSYLFIVRPAAAFASWLLARKSL